MSIESKQFKDDVDLERSNDSEGRFFEEIKELEEPLWNILESLKSELEKGEIDLLIGDDASGRIPTLVLRKVISSIYKEKGFDTPETLFFAGGGSGFFHSRGSEAKDRTTDIAVSLMDSKAKKALVVTDTIVTGRSLMPVIAALKAVGIPYEIAVVSFDSDSPRKQEPEDLSSKHEEKLGTKIHHGRMVGTPGIYYNRRNLDFAASGVIKNPGDLHATPLKKISVDPDLTQQVITESRKDVDILAKKLSEKIAEN